MEENRTEINRNSRAWDLGIQASEGICSRRRVSRRMGGPQRGSGRGTTRVDLPEKVDVAVCDQIGRFGFEAGVGGFFHDVRERLLKPGGKLVPRRVSMHVVP